MRGQINAPVCRDARVEGWPTYATAAGQPSALRIGDAGLARQPSADSGDDKARVTAIDRVHLIRQEHPSIVNRSHHRAAIIGAG